MPLYGLTPPKLLFFPLAAFVGVASFTSAGGTSETIKTALTTALSTAGRGGVAVPLQAGVDGTQATFVEGVDTLDGVNRVPVFIGGGNRKRLQDGNGNDVFAKVTTSAGDWLLSYFSVVAGVETAFAMPAAALLDFDVPYIFTAAHFPLRGLTAPTERHVAPDLAAYGWREQVDTLTVSATNTISTKLSKTYDGRKATITLFQSAFSDKSANPAFSVAVDGTVTWNAANAGVQLDPGDPMIAVYTY